MKPFSLLSLATLLAHNHAVLSSSADAGAVHHHDHDARELHHPNGFEPLAHGIPASRRLPSETTRRSLSRVEDARFEFDNDSLRYALKKYFRNPEACEETYGPIGTWDTHKVTDFFKLFSGRSEFNADISQWNTSSVTTMFKLFTGATAFNQPIGAWDISKVTDLKSAFNGATHFNQDISAWDTSNVVDMKGTFHQASSFNQDLGNWDTSKVTTMKAMFHGASSFNQGYLCWDTQAVVNLNPDSMFEGAGGWNSVDCPPPLATITVTSPPALAPTSSPVWI